MLAHLGHRHLIWTAASFLILLLALYSTRRDASIRAPGIVRAEAELVSVLAETGGRIKRVYVQEGSNVRQGDPLVQLDPREHLLRRKAIETQIHFAPERPSLYDELETIRLNLDRLTITSPIDGQIATLAPLRPGDLVSRGSIIATFEPTAHNLVVEAWLTSADRPFVEAGQSVRLHSDAFPTDEYDVIGGIVISISPDNRVRITPDTFDLHPGMKLEVHFGEH